MTYLPNAERYGKKICGIIYCSRPQVNGKQFLKYRYVDNSETGLKLFVNFAKKFPDAKHINFYDKVNYQFIEQLKL